MDYLSVMMSLRSPWHKQRRTVDWRGAAGGSVIFESVADSELTEALGEATAAAAVGVIVEVAVGDTPSVNGEGRTCAVRPS